MGEDAWLEAAYEDRMEPDSAEDFYGWSADEPDDVSEPFTGTCDGCEVPRDQRVWRVTGTWGTAVVCEYHRDHE